MTNIQSDQAEDLRHARANHHRARKEALAIIRKNRQEARDAVKDERTIARIKASPEVEAQCKAAWDQFFSIEHQQFLRDKRASEDAKAIATGGAASTEPLPSRPPPFALSYTPSAQLRKEKQVRYAQKREAHEREQRFKEWERANRRGSINVEPDYVGIALWLGADWPRGRKRF